jgi:hypothetical protein
MPARTCADFFGIILGALLLLFCCSIISAVRRWLKTQTAAEMGAANEAICLRGQSEGDGSGELSDAPDAAESKNNFTILELQCLFVHPLMRIL